MFLWSIVSSRVGPIIVRLVGWDVLMMYVDIYVAAFLKLGINRGGFITIVVKPN